MRKKRASMQARLGYTSCFPMCRKRRRLLMNSQDQVPSAVPSSEADAIGEPAFPVVGLGASAGGFAALLTLLENMPSSPGMALVVVLHLSPDYPSNADKLLQGATDMPVVAVNHRTPILPDQVYVIPPGCSLKMKGGHLYVDELLRPQGDLITIDVFFCTLAEAHKENAIGVVLSGMGSDGVAGLACIKAHGGVAIAQLPADAEESSMPQSAIESGMADFVLSASQIPAKLMELHDTAQSIRRHGLQGNAPAGTAVFDMRPQPQETLQDIFSLLRARTGHDFRQYKQPTLLRRLERRLQVRAVPDLPGYCRLLEKDHSEAHALLKDLLIGVTSFFRDRDAFAALDQLVVPQLLQSKGPDDELRAWVAACSTGEEAYSMAILLREHAAAHSGAPKMQVFASDIDERAIHAARLGMFPASIAADVTPAHLQRYFTLESGRYRVRKALRDTVLFTSHNLLHDPAFSRLDIVSCRNFLIYLNREMHRQVLETFHFALNPGGYLFLGSAESADAASHLFAPVDARHRIYQAKPLSGPLRRAPAPAKPEQPARLAAAFDPPPTEAVRVRRRMFSFAEIHQHKVMELGPPSILVNAGGEIVHIAEHAIRYLRHASGEPTRDIVSLVAPELRLELRMALFQAQKTGKPAATPAIQHEKDGKAGMVGMTVVPFEDEHADGPLLLVQFNEAGAALPLPPAAPDRRDASLMRQLEEELRHTQDRLHETMDQADMSNAELRAANEELQSTVEELRSAVEEQDTSREELQSANEELMTVNAQLKLKVDETAKSHDDLSNLIASTDIATIFLDREMRIKRYTPRVKDIFNIIAADVGRPLSHLASRLDYPQLVDEAARVFETLQPTEREARSRDGRFYIIRVSPYRTTEDRIDGAVMTFFDITIRRAAEQALRQSEEQHRAELEQQVRERTAELKASRDLLQATMDTSMDMIQVFEAVRDERGEIVDFRWVLNNHTSESRYGEVRGQSLLERNPGVVKEGIFDAFKHVTETGEPQQAERHYTHEQFDGWFLQSVVKLGDGVATTTKEITEWKRSQEEVLRLRDEIVQAKLRESEGRFRALVEGAEQAVWETDAQGMVVTDSPSWRAYTGQSLEEWMGKGWVNAVHPEDREGALRQWQEAVAGRRLVNAEFRLRSLHGWRWTNVRAAPVFDDDGSLRKWVGLNIDISARKDIEFALHQSTERMHRIVRQATAGVVQTDDKGNMTLVNRKFCDMLGYTEAELLGRSVADVTAPDSVEATVDAVRQLAAGRTDVVLEKQYLRKDGSPMWAESSVSGLHGPNGEFQGVVAIVVDIGARKPAGDSLSRAPEPPA